MMPLSITGRSWNGKKISIVAMHTACDFRGFPLFSMQLQTTKESSLIHTLAQLAHFLQMSRVVMAVEIQENWDD